MQMARNEPSCSGAEFKVPDTGEGKIYCEEDYQTIQDVG